MIEHTEIKTLMLPGGAKLPLVPVPSGSFLLGPENVRDDIGDYYIGVYPVTVGQYREFVNAGGYQVSEYWTRTGWMWRNEYNIQGPDDAMLADPFREKDHPQVGISWYEAAAFCIWLSHHVGQAIVLPNEAEWEKAARGSDGRKYPWGAVPPTDIHCNFDFRRDHTTPVGIFPAGRSPLGCYDMLGNIWEWCRNTAGPLPYRDIATRENLEYRDARVSRGGAWNSRRKEITCWAQNVNFPNIRERTLGFRIAMHISASC